MNIEALMTMRAESVGLDDLAELGPGPAPVPDDPIEWFWQWASADDFRSLAGTLQHLETFWSRRSAPNIELFHYRDYQRDLPGQLRSLADVLSIECSDSRIEEFAEAATFDRMKERAADLAPNADQGLWHDNASFFHRGLTGQWRELLDDDDVSRYQARVAELVPPGLAAWAHHGWLGTTVPGPETVQI